MPPTSDKDGFRWRIEDVYRTVTGEAFAKLVAENDLKVEGPFQGYFYAKLKAEDGWELYRTLSGHKWVYQARRVCTQDNVAGGVLNVNLSVATGQLAVIRSLNAVGPASAGATLQCITYDEDTAAGGYLANIPAGASRSFNLPTTGTAANATSNLMSSEGFVLAPGMTIKIAASAAAQTETLSVAVVMELYNLATVPTWSTTGSGGTPNLAASTISDANTLQEVLC